jgi:MFS transporter, PAT family, beta-lactamase induction signal transducer AmpG
VSSSPPRPTPPWYFLFLDFPYAATVGFISIATPFWLERGGVPIEQMAIVEATAFGPLAYKIFWVPLLDLGSFKRIWYLACSAAVAMLLVAASMVGDPSKHLGIYTLLLTAMVAAATTQHAALNALMALTPRPEDKGRVGGYAMACNVGGTGLFGFAAIQLGERVSAQSAGLILASLSLAGAALALRIVEPRTVDEEVTRAGSLARALELHLASMLKDLWRTVRSREGFTGLVICLAPVGCQAMSNLFSGVGTQYDADANQVAWTNGVAGGVASAVGSVLGGWLADRMNRRVAYAASGGLTAISAVAMALAPMTPLTYTWGTITYLFAGGIAFATWAGMVLEMVGRTPAAATKYALFNAAANLAINYVTFLNGQGAAWATSHLGLLPARGALYTDALLTLAGISLLLAMLLVTRRPGQAGKVRATAA